MTVSMLNDADSEITTLNNNDEVEVLKDAEKSIYLPSNVYIAIIGVIVIAFSSASAMFGYSSGCLVNLYLILFCSLTVTEFVPFSIMITFLTTAVSLIFGLKTHIEEATTEQMFVNYDLIRLILPVMFLGIKVGMILNLVLSNSVLVFSSIITIGYTTILVAKR